MERERKRRRGVHCCRWWQEIARAGAVSNLLLVYWLSQYPTVSLPAGASLPLPLPPSLLLSLFLSLYLFLSLSLLSLSLARSLSRVLSLSRALSLSLSHTYAQSLWLSFFLSLARALSLTLSRTQTHSPPLLLVPSLFTLPPLAVQVSPCKRLSLVRFPPPSLSRTRLLSLFFTLTHARSLKYPFPSSRCFSHTDMSRVRCRGRATSRTASSTPAVAVWNTLKTARRR